MSGKARTKIAYAGATRAQSQALAGTGRKNRGGAQVAPPLSENRLHCMVREYLDRVLLPDSAFWSTFPSGGYLLNPIAAALLKRRGLKAGMPDVFIWFCLSREAPWQRNCRCVGIELKAKSRYPSKAQKDVFYKLHRVGVNVWVCRDIDDVSEALRMEGVPTREAHPDLAGDGESALALLSRTKVSDGVSPYSRRVQDDPAA